MKCDTCNKTKYQGKWVSISEGDKEAIEIWECSDCLKNRSNRLIGDSHKEK